MEKYKERLNNLEDKAYNEYINEEDQKSVLDYMVAFKELGKLKVY